MENFLVNLPNQILNAVQLGSRFRLPASYHKLSKVLFCGMGGSAIGGDILASLSSQAGFVFRVKRHPQLPKWVDSSTLVIFSSYSGNTVETLNTFEEALRSKAKTVAVTSGGKMLRLARRKKIPFLQLPSGLPPRCAIGTMTFALVPVLNRHGWIKVSPSDVRETVRVIRTVPKAKARSIARRLKGQAVHFYGVAGFAEPALLRWRAQFAENAKTLASHHVIPELFHNEIEGWRYPQALMRISAAVFLLDRGDAAWMRKKIRGVQAIMRNAGTRVLEVRSRGRSLLARLFSLIAMGDWVSFELAHLNGVDPLPILNIEKIKEIH